MSAFAPVTLVKGPTGTDTEVFGPQSIDATGVARWLGTAASYDAKKSVTMQVTLPRAKGTVARIKQRVIIPQLDAVTGAKVGENYINIEGVFAKTADAATRQSCLSIATSLLDDQITTKAYQNLEAIY